MADDVYDDDGDDDDDDDDDGDDDQAWQTNEQEIHPSVHGNGVETADFFKEQFGMTARESSAVLIGAHSYGQFHASNSMFKYSWTRDQTRYLNNQVQFEFFKIQHFSVVPASGNEASIQRRLCKTWQHLEPDWGLSWATS